MRNLMWPSYGSIEWIVRPDYHASCDAEDLWAYLDCEGGYSTSLFDDLPCEATAERFAVESVSVPAVAVTARRLAA